MSLLIPEDALQVQINAFRTPASVWATEIPRQGMSEARLELFDLERKLSEQINNKKRTEEVAFREADDLVAVRSLHDGREWHRGKIECRMELMTGPQYRVHLVDHGITVRVKPQHLRNLPFRCDNLPPQALLLVLEGIVPINLSSSSNLDSFRSEICNVWTPAAETFVEVINKDHVKSFFVEKGGYAQHSQTRYGDLLIVMKNEAAPTSLRGLLCEKGYAKYCREEFEKRLQIAAKSDTYEICNSPLTIDSSLDSCSPSPARAMMSSSIKEDVGKESLTIEAYLRKAEKQKILKAAAPPVPQESPEICSNSKADQSSSISKFSRRSLFEKVKKSYKSGSVENNLVSSPEPPKETLLNIPSSPVKALDSRFVPAGFIMKNETKAKWRSTAEDSPLTETALSSSSRSYSSNAKSSDSEEGSLSRKAHSGFGQAARENLKSHSVRAETSHTDLSISDSSSPRKPERSCSNDLNKSDCPDSSDSGMSADKPHMSVRHLSVLLKKQRIVQSSDLKPHGPPECPSKEIGQEIIKETSAKVPDSASGVASPSLMRDRILSAIDDDISSEDYLARSVLLHGGFRPKPWMTCNELKLKFSTQIEKYLLERRWCYNILTLQKFMWPAIQQRQNVVMISPKKSGKTTSYVIPLMDFMASLEETPKGNGPMVIILCSGSQAATNIYEECVRALNGLKKAPHIQVAYGLAFEQHSIINLINGCGVFVTTPPCLLRFLKDRKYLYTLNFQRLNHYVLDEADILMTRFLSQIKEIQAILVTEQNNRIKNCDEKDPIQIILSSEKWDPCLLSFSEHMRGTPLLCINDCFEACVYGKPDVVFHLTKSENKTTKLLHVLRDIAGLHKVVLFCDETEVSKIEEFLNNECMNCLVVQPHSRAWQLEAILSSWQSSKTGNHYVLVCTDSDFEGLKIQDASCAVHYSLPSTDRSFFVKRLSSILGSIPNRFEGKVFKSGNETPCNFTPAIHLLMDESNSEQLPVIVQLMQRISDTLGKELLEIAEAITMKKEMKMKVNKLFCQNLKMYGQCWKMSDCLNRHVFLPELDESEDLPSSGVVSMQVTQVHSAGHYSVRLVEHIQDKITQKWPSRYLTVGMLMFEHFSKCKKVLVSEINIGDVYAVETDEGLYQRVQVLEIGDKDRFGDPISVLVQFLDEGHQSSIRVYMLYCLPEDLKAFPAQVVDVFLCGLLPADQDSDYGRDANACVRKWTKGTADSEEEKLKLLRGKIVMSMTGSLWIEPINVIEWLPHSETFVVQKNIRESLLQEHFALENPQHMEKLLKLCGKDVSVLSKIPATVKYSEEKIQPKPDWAFLESDVFEDVEFISAEDISLFFVRREKFNPLLNNLIDDIDRETPARKHDEVLLLTPGSLCLSKYAEEPKWHRVKIISKNEDGSFTVFFVDHGDMQDVSIEALKCIPDWAITRLPFQAIECSLAGISSCDTVDKLYDITESGAKDLSAKVCERTKAKLTGGNHFVIVVIDCSKSDPSILNRDLLALDGVEPCEDQLKFLDFEIDSSLFNRLEKISEIKDVFDQDPELNLSDLEFKEEDLSGFVDPDTDDGFGNFEVFGLEDMAKDFQRNNAAMVQEVAKKTKDLAQGEMKLALPANVNTISAKVTVNKENTSHKKVEDEDLSDWEDEAEFVGRLRLPVLCSARPPSVKWLEDLYYVWIKISLTGVKEYFLKWTYDNIQFSTTVRGRHYHFNQQLRGVIFPDSLVSSAKGFTVEVKMKKVYSGVLWGRPFASRRRFAWVSRDLEAFVAGSSDTDGDDCLGAMNKEIRKIPLKHRRRRREKHMKDVFVKPDLLSDSENSNGNGDYEMVDSDEMF